MPQYHVYIDEAGDPGVKQKSDGADWTDWFAIGAVIVSDTANPDTVDWVKDMKEAARSQAGPPLHYRNLSPTNQARLCRMLSRKKARVLVVASHKDTMRDHYNPRLGRANGQKFYNWCLRLLLERVTEWCYRRSVRDGIDDCSARIVFSKRGGHKYDDLKIYLRKLEAQSLTGNLTLSKRRIISGVISEKLLEIESDMNHAGLQLADIAVSAFFNAANSLAAKHDLEPATTLKPIVPNLPGTKNAAEFGLLRLPFAHQGQIPVADRAIFEEYGYVFR